MPGPEPGAEPAARPPLAGRRLLGVFAHPDDECFAAGLLADCAGRGARVDVVCLTSGEAAPRRGATDPPPDRVAATRAAELAASCRALGCEPPQVKDFPDGGLERVEPLRLHACLAELQLRLRPQVIVTLGRDGVYGHRDHIAVCRALSSLEQHSGGPRLLHTLFPRGLFAGMRRALARRHPGLVAGASETGELGDDPGAATLSLELAELGHTKLRAIACHRSQLVAGDPHSWLAPGLVERLLEHEWYLQAGGPPLSRGATSPFD